MAYLLNGFSNKKLITQVAHGFAAGDVLYNNNGTYAKAKADSISTAIAAGVVESAATDTFILVSSGPILLTGLTANSSYFLSSATAGSFTTTRPSADGHYIVPVLTTGTASRAVVTISNPDPRTSGNLDGQYVNLTGDTMTGALTIGNGTITADAPVLILTQTWNNASVVFTGAKMDVTDTASNANSLLMDLQVGSVSRVSFGKSGNPTFARQEADTTGPTLTLRKRGNTGDATAAVASGVTYATIRVQGWTGSNSRSGASITFNSLAAFSESTTQSRILFNVAPSGSITLTNYATLDSAAFTLTNGCPLVITRGTLTANAPSINLSETWNSGATTFTGILTNTTDTASNAESMLMRLQVAGSDVFSVRKDGAITSGLDRTAGLTGAYLQHNSTDTNSQPHLLSIVHATSGTPAASFGGIFRVRLTTTDATVQTASALVTIWRDPTTVSRTSELQIQTLNNGTAGVCAYFATGQMQVASGSASVPNIAHLSNPDTGFYFASTTSMAFTVDTTQRVLIDSTSGLSLVNGSRLIITQGTITSNLPGIDHTVTWNNSGVTFENWKMSVTATAQGAGSRYISILKDGNDFALLDNLARWHVFRMTADNSAGTMTMFKRGTTGDATAAVASDAALGSFATRGWNGSAYHSDASGMFVFADETFTGTNGGTRVEIRTVTQGTASNGAYAKFQPGAVTLQAGCRLVITRGTLTANAPSISITETWNNAAVAFTGIQSNITNTASASTSNIIDLQVDGISKFTQDYTGRTYIQRQVADNAPLIVELRKRGNGSGINNAPASGDNVGRIDFRGWDGTSTYAAGATIQMQATEAWSSSASGGRLFLACTPTGSITSTSYVQLDNVSADPKFSLINGARLIITQGTITSASLISFDTSVTWNAAVTFTGWKFNATRTLANAASLLIDMQVDAISRFTVNTNGTITGTRQVADTAAATLQLSKRGTTGDATAAVASGDSISSIDSLGWDGTSQGTVALVRLLALENFTNTAHGCRLLIGIPSIGSTTTTTRVDIRATSLGLSNGCSFICTLGTITAAQPVFDSTVTWNNAGVTFAGIQLVATDTASNAASLLLTLATGAITAFKVRKDGLTTIGSPTATGSAPSTAQCRLVVGNVASPNVVQINGNSTADNVPALSLFRSGSREAVIAVVGTTLYISNTGGVANHTDTNCSTAPHLSLTSGGSVVCTTGTITSAFANLSGTVTWNNAGITFTGWLLNVTNTASAATSLLLDLQVGGSSRFSVGVAGQLINGQTLTDTSGTVHGQTETMTVTPAAGSANFYASRINYTVNASGAQTGQVSGIFISATETNLNGIGHKLIDARGATTAFSIDGAGVITTGSNSARPTSMVHGIWITGSTAPSANPNTGIAIWSDTNEFAYRTAATNEGAGQLNRVHNRAAQVTGSGTNYTLTNSTARVDFGTTDAEVSLPTSGTYLVIACVSFIGDVAGAGDDLRAKLRNSSDSTDVGAEKRVTMSTNSGREIIMLDEVVTVTASKTIQIFGHNATSARGSVESTTTTIKYVRLY